MTGRADDRPGGGRGDFIRDAVAADVAADLAAGRAAEVATRFPPEPNGYLHIGHAKSICLNFGVAREFGGRCRLRLDDTNPEKEDQAYADAIERDVRWLGFAPDGPRAFASDNFAALYDFARHLVARGLAYVDDQSAEEIRANRGTLTEPGTDSPCRGRTPAENGALFERMRAGEFPAGARVLRARIDMASGNMNLRDPVLYRILHAPHARTGDEWPIYPTYDFAHGQCDALEGVTHSLCTLEFADHRPLYDWLAGRFRDYRRSLPGAAGAAAPVPRQFEFARLELTHTVLSKRRLAALAESGAVEGWDDPRMPTLAGLRRRGFPPGAIREFCARVGVGKRVGAVEIEALEHCVREALDRSAPRRMAVLRPLKVVIENYPEGRFERLEAANHPRDPDMGTREVPFGREIYIERDDFALDPPRKFRRLAPGREVRLRYAYFIACREAVVDEAGEVAELRCTYDPETRGGGAPDGRKVRGALHWVSCAHAVDGRARLTGRLFAEPAPGPDSRPDPRSLETVEAKLEPALAEAAPDAPLQFERLGYFVRDSGAPPGAPVFNRTLTLRDGWAKILGATAGA